ncbi:hypothetical protein BDE18_4048 [Paracoccus pantotrophus]|uniref:Uncharacterized protein n=1 Tax=Paracoccus pantotrophus TaxID=82367 RepID=A0AAE6NU13_PARPN|nr:hypothetical protein [Paracoccus pantotrophus]QFG36309.1 hypothetical protein ESD82_08825 [Paracoccus pantotrophus]RKS43108.1 hypothetical protein BDE18_4048 [Paracoccus pantotrophus]
MSDVINFTQGAFAVYDPDDTAVMSSFIPFRFNPESLTRQLQLEQAQGAEGGAEPGAQGAGGSSGEQGADASSGTLKESFSVVLRFDLADRVEAHSSLPVEFGVLPEISALEELLYPVESETEAPSDGSEPVRARGRRPIVLFIWGERRVVPVKITGMAIAETFFNGKLYPVRAEIEVGLEVLGEVEARDNTRVQSSLNFTAANRRKMARLYLDTTADQGTSINLPQ